MSYLKRKEKATPNQAKYKSPIQSILTAGTTPRTNNIIFAELKIPNFQASGLSPNDGRSIDVLSAIKPIAQTTTPIKEADWTAFKNTLLKATPFQQKDESNYDSNSSESDYDPEDCKQIPISSSFKFKGIRKINPMISPGIVPQRMVDPTGRTGSLLIPSQMCLKKKSRRVSSFLDQNDTTVASAALMIGLTAIQEANKKEETKKVIKKGTIGYAKPAMNMTDVVSIKKDLIPKKGKPKLNQRGSMFVRLPKTPTRRNTVVVPMAPLKECVMDESDDSSLERISDVTNN